MQMKLPGTIRAANEDKKDLETVKLCMDIYGLRQPNFCHKTASNER